MSNEKHLKIDNHHADHNVRNSNEKERGTIVKSYTANAKPAPKPPTKKREPVGTSQRRRGSDEKPASKINLTESISKQRKEEKIRKETTDWGKIAELKVRAAEKDGMITGVIALVAMAMMFGLYMIIAKQFPILSPHHLVDKLVYELINFIVVMATGGYTCVA